MFMEGGDLELVVCRPIENWLSSRSRLQISNSIRKSRDQLKTQLRARQISNNRPKRETLNPSAFGTI
jgi:hypothetical protein